MCVENFEKFMEEENTNEEIWNNYPYQEKNSEGGHKLFVKDDDGHRYGFWGLRIRSHEILRKLEKLEVGEEMSYPPWTKKGDSFHKYMIKRVE